MSIFNNMLLTFLGVREICTCLASMYSKAFKLFVTQSTDFQLNIISVFNRILLQKYQNLSGSPMMCSKIFNVILNYIWQCNYQYSILIEFYVYTHTHAYIETIIYEYTQVNTPTHNKNTHYITLHCTTLYCTTLHYIALHYMHRGIYTYITYITITHTHTLQLCMHACIHYTHATYTCICAQIHTHTCIHNTQIHPYACIHAYIHMNTYACIHIIHTHTYLHAYIHK